MKSISNRIVRHRKLVIAVFLTAVLISVFLASLVNVNYNMVDYLPDNAQSTRAIQIMDEEFDQAIPNASVMVRNVSIAEALDYKEQVAQIDHVSDVLWLDDVINILEPLEIAPSDTVESFYKASNALFSVTIEKGFEQQACDDILALIDEDDALAGEAPGLVTLQSATGSEVMKAMLILVPIIVLILILSTSSWVEPLLFFAAIGISIVMNMGTNAFLPNVSFMTNAVTPVLQMAVSLDYAIFLLHSFSDMRQTHPDIKEAMRMAIRKSMPIIAASAITTLFGFLALVFMHFKIGSDLGLNLAKGIVFSFISVTVFLPALTLVAYKLIDKTSHRQFLPGFKNAFKVISKIAIPVIILVALLIVPSYLGQQQTTFTYGNDAETTASRSGRDTLAIEEVFGKSTVVALLVPRGDAARELLLAEDLQALERVTSVTSYATTVSVAIPPEIVGEDRISSLYSDNYARLIIYTDTPPEGDDAFATVEAISQTAYSYYTDDVYLAGPSANTYDMKQTVQTDFLLVNLIAIAAIFLVLLLTFRSLTLPIILLLTIEAGIWINLAIPYFSGVSLGFIGFLIISSVQLGATVDYAILMTGNYLSNRRLMPKHQAISQAVGSSFRPILISGTILASAGFVLYATSSNPAIYEMGLLVGRGAVLSMAMVLLFLPAMLNLLDHIIEKTTLKANFKKNQAPFKTLAED